MTASIQVTLNDDEIMKKFDAIAGKGKSLEPVMAAFGDYKVKEVVTLFEQEKDPEGNPWKALSAFTMRFKKNDSILTESADLRNSFHRASDAVSVRVGTDRPYAAVHQFGIKKTLNIRPHRRKVKSRGKKGVQSGVSFVKAHTRKVNTQARPFLGFIRQDRVELMEIIKDYLGIQS